MRGQNLHSLGILLVVALALLAPTGLRPAQEAEESTAKAVPDTQIGLVKESVFEVPSPEPFPAEAGDPGDQEPLPRTYPSAPPRISHAVGDYLPISLEENLCLDCHVPGEAVVDGPTPPSPSHVTDLRNAPDKMGQSVVGARYVCMSCHVPQTDAEPLVGNSFGDGE